MRLRALLLSVLLAGVPGLAAATTPVVTAIRSVPQDHAAAPFTAGGRVARAPDGVGVLHQWPGAYFETAFEGEGIVFVNGPGDVILHVQVDGRRIDTLDKPVGAFRIGGLAPGAHRVRVEVATESQSAANRFGGFRLPPGAHPFAMPVRARRIEFIGDSHTVGYANLSTRRECDDAEVWRTTDTTRAFGPLVAAHYGADVRVNAISGRGVVRNYTGGAGDTLPVAYPYVLFDHSSRDEDTRWQPQVIVIALGTNDFSTPLRPDERWATRDALRDDYVQAHVAFVRSLRTRHPDARFVLWATDGADGEIRAQVRRVEAQLRAQGDDGVSFVAVDGLAMDACRWHPSAADDRIIADLLVRHIDAMPVSPWPDP